MRNDDHRQVVEVEKKEGHSWLLSGQPSLDILSSISHGFLFSASLFCTGHRSHPALTLVHWTVLSANSFVQNQGFIIFEPDEIAHWTGFDVASMCTTLKTPRRVPAVNGVDLVLCYLPLGNDAAKSKQQELKFPSAFSNSGQVRPFKVMWL